MKDFSDMLGALFGFSAGLYLVFCLVMRGPSGLLLWLFTVGAMALIPVGFIGFIGLKMVWTVISYSISDWALRRR